jgi:5-methylcytosine-specific restriction endonuclease McrA
MRVSRPGAASTATALVLNATYEPLCVVPVRRAVVLVLTDKAVSVADGDGFLRSAEAAYAAPAVVRLTRFVRVPYRAQVALTRKAVFARDSGRCAYCGKGATTIDHVVPRSRGGRHSWDNVVAACSRCNHLKADRTLSDLGWRLRVPPTAPSGAAWRVLGHRAPDPRWNQWLEMTHHHHGQEQESA